MHFVNQMPQLIQCSADIYWINPNFIGYGDFYITAELVYPVQVVSHSFLDAV